MTGSATGTSVMQTPTRRLCPVAAATQTHWATHGNLLRQECGCEEERRNPRHVAHLNIMTASDSGDRQRETTTDRSASADVAQAHVRRRKTPEACLASHRSWRPSQRSWADGAVGGSVSHCPQRRGDSIDFNGLISRCWRNNIVSADFKDYKESQVSTVRL